MGCISPDYNSRALSNRMSLQQSDMQFFSNQPSSDCDSAPTTPSLDWALPPLSMDAWEGLEPKIGSRAQNYQWSDEENRRYFDFMVDLRERLGSVQLRGRVRKINIQMSRAVKSRTPKQCRSHNQKMLKRLGSPDAIISYFEAYFARKYPSIPLQLSPEPSDYQSGQNELSILQGQKQEKISYLWPITKWDLLCALYPRSDEFLRAW